LCGTVENLAPPLLSRDEIFDRLFSFAFLRVVNEYTRPRSTRVADHFFVRKQTKLHIVWTNVFGAPNPRPKSRTTQILNQLIRFHFACHFLARKRNELHIVWTNVSGTPNSNPKRDQNLGHLICFQFACQFLAQKLIKLYIVWTNVFGALNPRPKRTQILDHLIRLFATSVHAMLGALSGTDQPSRID
jgi:hypothetical protein